MTNTRPLLHSFLVRLKRNMKIKPTRLLCWSPTSVNKETRLAFKWSNDFSDVTWLSNSLRPVFTVWNALKNVSMRANPIFIDLLTVVTTDRSFCASVVVQIHSYWDQQDRNLRRKRSIIGIFPIFHRSSSYFWKMFLPLKSFVSQPLKEERCLTCCRHSSRVEKTLKDTFSIDRIDLNEGHALLLAHFSIIASDL